VEFVTVLNTKHSTCEKNEAIVFEVKTNQISAPQIVKYTDTKIFDKAYEVIPCIKNPESYAGLITINPAGQILVYECQNPIPFSAEKQRAYFNWVEIYLKVYVLANLMTNELESLLSANGIELNRKNLFNFIKSKKFDDLVRDVKRIIAERQS
jgi:hypothetical protein